MSDTDATQARQDVVADVDEIIEHVINGNMLNMPYDVYVELFDAVDGLGVEIENLQSENAKLRELATMLHRCARGMLRDLAPSCVDRSKEGCGMDCTDNGERCCMELLERRMHELGVEVSE